MAVKLVLEEATMKALHMTEKAKTVFLGVGLVVLVILMFWVLGLDAIKAIIGLSHF